MSLQAEHEFADRLPQRCGIVKAQVAMSRDADHEGGISTREGFDHVADDIRAAVSQTPF